METENRVRRALVLSGGGVTGVAWELGILTALSRAGIDVTGADLIVGTSAGSVVGAQITSGRDLEQLITAQLAPPEHEIAVEFDANQFQQMIMGVINEVGWNAQAIRAGIGKAARAAKSVPEDTRLEVIKTRLGSIDWPAQRLLINVVDAENGDWKVFDSSSGVGLVEAVTASCAVPMVWPPVTIQGRAYIDGGMRSGSNADLAQGYDRVLILNPMVMPDDMPPVPGSNLKVEKELLEKTGSRVVVIQPDEATLKAIGPNVLDPARRAAAAEAGLEQDQSYIAAVRELWS